MKIIQFFHGNEIGGMEKFCLDLSNALSLEHEIMLIADPVFKPYCNEKINFVELDLDKSRNNPLFLLRIYRIIKAFHSDIIHVHTQKSIKIMQRLFLDIPFVATKHNVQKRKAFYGLKYAISISDDTTKTIDAKKIFKIYNGIPYVAPKKIDMPNTFNIVAIGGLRKVKGYDSLIMAMAKLPFDFHLTIVGKGNEYTALKKLIREYALEGKVSLVGYKDNVQDYLYSADLQIISSLSEGFSLSMVEGIFYTPALISTKVGVGVEILSSDLLYDIEELDQKIIDVQINYKRYQDSLEKVKTRYKDLLTIDMCAQEHEQVYKEIIKDFHG